MKKDQIQWILTQKTLPRIITREDNLKGMKTQPQIFIDQVQISIDLDHLIMLDTQEEAEQIGSLVTEDDMTTTDAILRENKVQITNTNNLKIITSNRAFSMVMIPNQNRKTNTGEVGTTDKINPGFLTKGLGEGIEIMATTFRLLSRNLRSLKLLLKQSSLTISASFQAAEKATDSFTRNQIAP